jgi:hypothetical protein
MLLTSVEQRPDRQSQLFRWTEMQYLLTQGHALPGFTDREVRLALGQLTEA